ncbi:SEC14-like protein 3 [Strongylocentrotus purpuratus]|uniref:CRAL-TRIO domain-containing protein n=1 Tax=Strongylocentrotus purpuratus TaxID=7668 RepID=A0A7M7PCJ3_STRPU|nr:SEC14-like protein 3 [Strongylocentrotus purpuratus]
MSGTLNDLTANQADALKELKSKLNDIQKPIHDVHQLLRFLRARKFDIKKTEAIIRQDIVWRAQMKVDTIHEWFKIPEVCLKYWPGGSLGLDKLGHVVWLSPIGNVDPKGLIYSVKTGDIIRTNIYVIERMVKEQEVISQKLGRHIEGITLIVDLDNLSASHMWKPGMAVMIELFTIIEEHYPGFIHQMFVVRPTKLLPIAYYLIRPCFTEDTRERIHVLGSNWREVLLKHIDAEILPVHWGGTLTDTDGVPNMCPSKV